MKRNNRQKGYSLVEAVIYTALVAAISILLVGCLFMMHRAFKETQSQRDLLDSAHTAMERMTREIRTASDINAGSTLGTAPGVLLLDTTDSGGTAKTVQFSLSGTTLRLTDNGVYYGDLTTGKVSVNSLIFREIPTANGTAVRIEMTLESLRSPSDKTVTLYNTVALRGSYE